MAVPDNHRVANLADPVGHDFGTSRPVLASGTGAMIRSGT